MASSADTRILDLMMPMFSGSKDEYGKDLVPPLPLSLDRVNGNRPPTSDAALFKLPFELLTLILLHIPSESLSSLAFVNSDCRQLARSAQFASVTFTYSSGSQHLLRSIIDGHSQFGPNQRFNIASCIRRITVATQPKYIQHYHQISLDDDFQNLEAETRDSRLNAASHAVFDVYFSQIQKLVCDPVIFPHLELLDWEDMIQLPKFFFDTLPLSNIQHLKLFRVQVAQEFKLTTREWPLRSLHLEILPSIRGTQSGCNISRLCHDMLRLCAPTLESLSWVSQRWSRQATFASDDIDLPKFPRLRHLELDMLAIENCATLEALVPDNLRVLNIRFGGTEFREFFSTRGRIPDLRVLVLHGRKSFPIEFIKSNNQLSKLSIDHQLPNDIMENDLLPVLSDSFSNLTSLHLSWEADRIPESCLVTIATLKTLRQLHLTAGNQFGWKHTWLINHNTILRLLSPLGSLKRLAFSRDTYQHKTYSWALTESYYYDNFVDLDHTGADAASAWEEIHRDRMLREADKYISKMPNLVWLYLGQLPIQVMTRPDGSRWPVSLSSERDDCWTLLKQMFGWKEGEKIWELAMLREEKL